MATFNFLVIGFWDEGDRVISKYCGHFLNRERANWYTINHEEEFDYFAIIEK